MGGLSITFGIRLDLDDGSIEVGLVDDVGNENSVPSIQATPVNKQHLIGLLLHQTNHEKANEWKAKCLFTLSGFQKDSQLMHTFEPVYYGHFCISPVGLDPTDSMFSDMPKTKLMIAIEKIQTMVFPSVMRELWVLKWISKPHMLSQKQIYVYVHGTFSWFRLCCNSLQQ